MAQTFWTGSSLSFTNGSKIVTVNTGPSVGSIYPNSMLKAGNYNEPVEVKAAYGTTIELFENWPGSTGNTSATISPSAAAAAAAGTAAQQVITEIQSLVGSASVTATANSFVKRDSSGRVKVGTPSANEDAVNKGYLGSAASKEVVNSNFDNTTGRLITTGYTGIGRAVTEDDEGNEPKTLSWNFNGMRHGYAGLKTKYFNFPLNGETQSLYLGTFREGFNTICLANKGNSGYNSAKIEFCVDFDSTGDTGVGKHNSAQILTMVKSDGMSEFKGLHSIKVSSDEAAIYIEYLAPNSGGTGNLAVSVFSTSVTIGEAYNPYETVTWNDISPSQMAGDSFRCPIEFEVNKSNNTFKYKGLPIFHEGSTNLNQFRSNGGADVIAVGVASTGTTGVFTLPVSSFVEPTGISVGTGSFNVTRNGFQIVSSGITAGNITFDSRSSFKYALFIVDGLVGLNSGEPLYLRTEGTSSTITVNF